jgi:hypothetical protein
LHFAFCILHFFTMTAIETPKPQTKPPHRDHPPVVPGTRRQALVFCVIVIFAILSPMFLGFKIGGIVPRLPALDWTLALDSRTRAAADEIHQPKIVFIGGSNIRFGLDAAALSRDLHVPVINYGLHASLGMDVIADRAMQCVKPGDIVVFAPELSHFRKAGAADYSDDLRIDFLADHPSSIDEKLQSFPTREWRRSRSRCNRIRGTIEKFVDRKITALLSKEVSTGIPGKPEATPYTVDAIGDDGQIVFPRPGPKAYERWTFSDPPDNIAAMDLVDSRGGVAFDLVKKICAERHCTLCVMPPLRVTVPLFASLDLTGMEQHFLDYAATNGAIEIMKPGETVLPREDGYDTDYHLNDAGVKLMEPRIAAALRPIVLRQPQP